MYFDSLASLWAMDGHGPFVWGAYAITFAILIGMPLVALKRHRQLKQDILRQTEEED